MHIIAEVDFADSGRYLPYIQMSFNPLLKFTLC